VKNATITIANNDGGKLAPYTFVVTGTGVSQSKIDVQGGTGSVDLTSGQTATTTTDGTDFGSADITAGDVNRTFTVKDLGSGALHLSGTQGLDQRRRRRRLHRHPADRRHARRQTVTRVAPSPPPRPPRRPSPPTPTRSRRTPSRPHRHHGKVHVGAVTPNSTTFGIEFDPTTTGAKTATVTIASDDPTVPSYTFDVGGTATSTSVLGVTGAGVSIASGDTPPHQRPDRLWFRRFRQETPASAGPHQPGLGRHGHQRLARHRARWRETPPTSPSSPTPQHAGHRRDRQRRRQVHPRLGRREDRHRDDRHRRPGRTLHLYHQGHLRHRPHVQVLGNSNAIAAGDTTPATSDFTDFGNASSPRAS